MLDKLMQKLGLGRKDEERPTEGERAHEREADARAFMLDGAGVTPAGGLIEVDESDMRPPAAEDPTS